MRNRIILHSDLNCFYASVECLYHPEYRNKPVAVGGSVKDRHGIILTKNQFAKDTGIKTGEAIWEAQRKCPDLIVLPPNYPLYLRFSKLVRDIYSDYSDKVEPFGIDECWVDITELGRDGFEVAEEIRNRIKTEIGITVSIGVSFNKIFAKLGSDIKKPDAVTVISRDNFKEKVWGLPIGELLYVGRATQKKLEYRAIYTIGQLAAARIDYLRSFLGKMGECLWEFANGLDIAPVAQTGDVAAVKSIGNSITSYRDLVNETDVKIVFTALSESVAMRLREQGFLCNTVVISVRDNKLFCFERQAKAEFSTCNAKEIAKMAMTIFKENYTWQNNIRSVGVRATNLICSSADIQTSLFFDEDKRIKMKCLDSSVDELRRRFGFNCVLRGVVLQDENFSKINAKDNHNIHPEGYF